MGVNKIKREIAWGVGTLLFLLGITANNFLSGILIIISSILTIPQTFSFINNKLNGKINPSIRRLIIVLVLFIGIAIDFNPKVIKNDIIVRKHSTSNVEEYVSTGPATNTIVDEEIQQEKVIITSVTDGDTLRADINGVNKPIRLIGIDTPELSHPSEPVQCYSQEAKKALEDLVLDKEVILEPDISDTDKYNRLLRYIWIDEVLVNEYMTQNGYAFSSAYPPDTKYQNRINAGEEYAKSNSLGLWAKDTCNGNVYTETYEDPNKILTTPIVPVTSVDKDTKTATYICNCKKTCSQMSSCDEAQYQLNVCGCTARDGDKDGIACDTNCQ